MQRREKWEWRKLPIYCLGLVTKGEDGLEGVTLYFSGGFGTATTGADGTWSKSGLSGTVTVTPAKDDYGFDPESIPVTGARDDINFTALYWQTMGEPCFSEGAAYTISLAVDNDGIPYVAYEDRIGTYNRKATAMKFTGTTWETVGEAGFSAGNVRYTSLALSSNGEPHVAYSDGSQGKATVMRYTGTNWEVVGEAGFSMDEIKRHRPGP